MAKASEREQALRPLIEAAASGRLAWLHKLLIDAGYIPETDRLLLGSTDLAPLLAITPRTLTRWRQDRGFPGPDKRTRRWDLADVLEWALSQIKTAVSSTDDARYEAQVRLLEERILKLQQDREFAAANLIDAGERLAVELRGLQDLRAALGNIPRRVAPDDQALETRIETELRAALSCLAEAWGAGEHVSEEPEQESK